MKKLLLLLFAFTTLRTLSQNVNVGEHTGRVMPVANMVRMHGTSYYFNRSETWCCADVLQIVGMNNAGQQVFLKNFTVQGWNFPVKLITTKDNCLLALTRSYQSCDVGPETFNILKIDTTGAILFQKPVANGTDIVQHADSSFYMATPNGVYHYSKTGNLIASSSNSLITSVTEWPNGQLLISSGGYNTRVTNSGSVVALGTTTAPVKKFIIGASGDLFGLCTNGMLAKYDSASLAMGTLSTFNTPFSLKIKDFVERNDSLFVTGVDSISNTPFYRILDQNFSVLHQTQATYSNVIPKGITVLNGRVSVATEGSSATDAMVSFKSFYQFPIKGSFVSWSDIGIVGLTVNSTTFTLVDPNYGAYSGQYNLGVKVKNFGTDTVHSFCINSHYISLPLCYYYLLKSFTMTIPPQGTVLVQTGDFYNRGISLGNTVHPTDTSYVQLCLFTTVPNASNDINIGNDEHCIAVPVTNITLAVKEQAMPEIHLSLSPNPVNNAVSIDSDAELKRVQVYNALGALQLASEAQQHHAIADVSGLSPGIYFVKVETSKGSVIKKIIKE